MFIAREKELSILNNLYKQNKFQLFILYGRRRVGKTTLLKEFCNHKESIFFSAEQTNEKMNLEKFSELIFQHYEEENLEPFGTWEKAVSFVHLKQQEKPLVLVFDEFPYLADMDPGLMSVLQHMIDHNLQYGKLFIVLCGSYVGFMEKEVLGAKSPLFGRRTAQMHMKSLDYLSSAEFLDGCTDEQKLLYYGTFGGTAMYLMRIRKDQPFCDNVMEEFLSPSGYLYEEPMLLLRQEVQEPGVYSAIIEAIASGASKANEIATKTGEESAKCLKYINTLRELGIVEREVPYGEKPNSRKSIYKISDPMFRFWYRYVSRSRSLLESGAQKIVWEKKVEPDINNYMGAVFEQVCKDYLIRRNSLGELPFLFTDIGRWWGSRKLQEGSEEVEIDIVAGDGEDCLICECKWRNQAVGYPILEKLIKNAELVNTGKKRVWYVLFSKSGFESRLEKESEVRKDIILIDLKDIMGSKR